MIEGAYPMITASLLKRQSGQYDEAVIQRVSLERQGLTDLKGALSNCKALVDLSLCQNELSSLAGLESQSELKRLDVSFNKIRRLEALESVPFTDSLIFLDLRGNLIDDIGEVRCLASLTALRSLYLRGPDGEDANPCCSHASYPEAVVRIMPLLEVLDGSHVKLIEASEQLERQAASIAPNDSCPSPEPESWFDAAELAALDDNAPSSAQGTLALQKQQKCIETIEGQLSKECEHLLSRASNLIQKSII